MITNNRKRSKNVWDSCLLIYFLADSATTWRHEFCVQRPLWHPQNIYPCLWINIYKYFAAFGHGRLRCADRLLVLIPWQFFLAILGLKHVRLNTPAINTKFVLLLLSLSKLHAIITRVTSVHITQWCHCARGLLGRYELPHSNGGPHGIISMLFISLTLTIHNKTDSPIVLKNTDLYYMFFLPEVSVYL